jgi:hypothetical protein
LLSFLLIACISTCSETTLLPLLFPHLFLLLVPNRTTCSGTRVPWSLPSSPSTHAKSSLVRAIDASSCGTSRRAYVRGLGSILLCSPL